MWIKTSFDFGSPCAIVAFGLRDAMTHGLHDAVAQRATSPDALHDFVTALIAKHRPELDGCEVFAMDMYAPNLVWNFYVLHPSLERVPLGKPYPVINLLGETPCGEQPASVDAAPTATP